MLLDVLKANPVVAIIRGLETKEAAAAARALYEGGIRLMEVTMNSPTPGASITEMRNALKGTDARIGAGTVTSLARLDEAAKAGAEFIISPNVDVRVIEETKRLGLFSIPGFLTPSEAYVAMEAGADVLKCFPCGALGPGYIKDLKAVVEAPIMAVGGVDLGNIEEFLKCAVGVGIASAIYKKGTPVEQLKGRAEAFVKLAKKA